MRFVHPKKEKEIDGGNLYMSMTWYVVDNVITTYFLNKETQITSMK